MCQGNKRLNNNDNDNKKNNNWETFKNKQNDIGAMQKKWKPCDINGVVT